MLNLSCSGIHFGYLINTSKFLFIRDHPKTIHVLFGFNQISGFWVNIFFTIWSYVKTFILWGKPSFQMGITRESFNTDTKITLDLSKSLCRNFQTLGQSKLKLGAQLISTFLKKIQVQSKTKFQNDWRQETSFRAWKGILWKHKRTNNKFKLEPYTVFKRWKKCLIISLKWQCLRFCQIFSPKLEQMWVKFI